MEELIESKECKGTCGKTYPKTLEFWRYRDNKSGLDYLCRPCRKAYDAKCRKKEVVNSGDIEYKLSWPRQSRRDFTKWMKSNPVYFECQFRLPATDENIASEYSKILGIDAIEILVASSMIGVDKVRCY